MTKIAGPGSFEAARAVDGQSGPTELPRRGPISKTVAGGLLALSDGLGTFAAGVAPAVAQGAVGQLGNWTVTILSSLCGMALVTGALYLGKGYRFGTLRRLQHSVVPALGAWLLLAVFALAVGASGARSLHEPPATIEWLIGALAVLLAGRGVLAHLMAQWAQAGRLTQRIAIVGASEVGERLIRRLDELDDVDLVGLYDDRVRRIAGVCGGRAVRGTTDDLLTDARLRRIDTIMVALPLVADRRISGLVAKLRQLPVTVTLCPEWFDLSAGQCGLESLGGMPVLRAADRPMRDWRELVKDIEDRVLGAIILALIAPVLAAIAIAIKLDSPGPVFFRQKRYGYNNELIEVFKFRSMYHHTRDVNAEQLTRRGDPRITRVGRYIRRASLDELPQFINVVRGEMSIVGPRPHALSAKAAGILYPDAVQDYHSRHRVKPGITGWAQVNGWRGETDTIEQIAKRVEHDLYYIEHWSLTLDLKIILRTIVSGFTGSHAF